VPPTASSNFSKQPYGINRKSSSVSGFPSDNYLKDLRNERSELGFFVRATAQRSNLVSFAGATTATLLHSVGEFLGQDRPCFHQYLSLPLQLTFPVRHKDREPLSAEDPRQVWQPSWGFPPKSENEMEG